MSFEQVSQNFGAFPNILEYSYIQDEAGKKTQLELTKVKQELAEAKEQIVQREKLLGIEKKTTHSLNQQQKNLKSRIQNLQERNKLLEARLKNKINIAQKDQKQQRTTESLQSLKSQIKEKLQTINQEPKQKHELFRQNEDLQQQLTSKAPNQEILPESVSLAEKTSKQLELFNSLQLQFKEIKRKLDFEQLQKEKFATNTKNLEEQMVDLKKEMSQTIKHKDFLLRKCKQLSRLLEQQQQQKRQSQLQNNAQNSQITKTTSFGQDCFEEDLSIKANYLHKHIIEQIASHLKKLEMHQKSSFLNILISWSDEMQERQQRQERQENFLDDE